MRTFGGRHSVDKSAPADAQLYEYTGGRPHNRCRKQHIQYGTAWRYRFLYAHWYIGGHSLGGSMAASYASAHSSQLSGVIMLAAYPSKSLNENTRAVIIYGSEDGVLNMAKLEEANRYLLNDTKTCVIEGGNHAQFGNYGRQDGDGIADISSEEQQLRTMELILQSICN